MFATELSPDTESTEEVEDSHSPAEEACRVIALEQAFWEEGGSRAGSVCYVIAYSWWQQWCSYTGFSLSEGRKEAQVQVRQTVVQSLTLC